jgi:hypothetical protein
LTAQPILSIKVLSLMKTFATFLAAAFAFLPMAGFAEPA